MAEINDIWKESLDIAVRVSSVANTVEAHSFHMRSNYLGQQINLPSISLAKIYFSRAKRFVHTIGTTTIVETNLQALPLLFVGGVSDPEYVTSHRSFSEFNVGRFQLPSSMIFGFFLFLKKALFLDFQSRNISRIFTGNEMRKRHPIRRLVLASMASREWTGYDKQNAVVVIADERCVCSKRRKPLRIVSIGGIMAGIRNTQYLLFFVPLGDYTLNAAWVTLEPFFGSKQLPGVGFLYLRSRLQLRTSAFSNLLYI